MDNIIAEIKSQLETAQQNVTTLSSQLSVETDSVTKLTNALNALMPPTPTPEPSVES